jgi:hypothetical protein
MRNPNFDDHLNREVIRARSSSRALSMVVCGGMSVRIHGNLRCIPVESCKTSVLDKWLPKSNWHDDCGKLPDHAGSNVRRDAHSGSLLLLQYNIEGLKSCRGQVEVVIVLLLVFLSEYLNGSSTLGSRLQRATYAAHPWLVQ